MALKSQLTTLNTERAAEEIRIEAARASNAALKAEMTEISAGLESMATTQKILKREIDSSRPVSDLRGVTAELAKKLNRAGIHTIGELAESSGTKLRTAGVVDNATEARALITEAKNRLK